MNLTKYEQETIINFNEGEAQASVYTYNQALQRKLNRLAQERPADCQLDKAQDYGDAAAYFIPKRWVKITPPRLLNEKQLAQIRSANQNTRFKSKTR